MERRMKKTDRLERLRRKKDELLARIAQLQAAEAKKQRAEDARRKILVGAVVLAAVERGEWDHTALKKLLEAGLVRDRDRALFGLPPKDGSDHQ